MSRGGCSSLDRSAYAARSARDGWRDSSDGNGGGSAGCEGAPATDGLPEIRVLGRRRTPSKRERGTGNAELRAEHRAAGRVPTSEFHVVIGHSSRTPHPRATPAHPQAPSGLASTPPAGDHHKQSLVSAEGPGSRTSAYHPPIQVLTPAPQRARSSTGRGRCHGIVDALPYHERIPRGEALAWIETSTSARALRKAGSETSPRVRVGARNTPLPRC